MRFGIEIEFGGSIQAVINELVSAGLAASASEHSYEGHSDRGWVVKRDGSVSRGGELVSPPLDFASAADREQVNRAIECLVRAGARRNEQAGIHVHIESAGFTATQLNALARTFIRFEDTLYRFATSGWATGPNRGLRRGARSYARPFNADMKQALARANTNEQLMRAYYGAQEMRYGNPSRFHGASQRYYGLNLHSHWYRGTVEFRIFNSSTSARRVQTFIAICHALMVDASSGRKRSINRAHNLGDMAAGRLDADRAIFQFLAMARYQAGMSLADYRNCKWAWRTAVAVPAGF